MEYSSFVSSKGGRGKTVLPHLLLDPERIASLQGRMWDESATAGAVNAEASGASDHGARIQPAKPTTLEEIAQNHGVPVVVPRAVYLNVSTFADRDLLTFLSLCTALEFKTIDHESPAGQAIQDWSLGHLIGPDQFTMSVIVRDVIRLVEAQLIQATQQHDT